jgi:hypothetical protein
MDATLKLGIMTATTIIVLWALAWALAEVIIFLTKDDDNGYI